jgi:tight adherence protein B
MKRTALTVIGLLMALGVLLGASAVAQEQIELRIEAVDAREFPTVIALVAPPEDFYGVQPEPADVTVLENGVRRPATARIVGTEPLEVMLVIDTSGSMSGAALDAAKVAAVQFVEGLPPGTTFGVLGFGDEPNLISAFSDDPADAIAAIDGLEATGETALYDAVVVALDQFDEASAARHFIVLLSDGGDTVSGNTLELTTEALDASEVGFYAVALDTDESDALPLEALAGVTAGRVAPAGDAAELSAIYDQIAEELVNQLAVQFTTATGGIIELAIEIRLDGQVASAQANVDLGAVVEQPTTTTSTSTSTSTTSATVVATTAAPATTIPSPPEVASPVAFVGSSPGALGTLTALVIAIIALFLAALLSFGVSLLPREQEAGGLRSAFGSEQRGSSVDRVGGVVSTITSRAQSLAEIVLRRSGRRSRLASSLDSAGIRLSPGEAVILSASAAITGLAVGLVLFGAIGGLVLGALSLFVPRLVLTQILQRRRAAFGDQLEGTLQLLASTLRAGYGLVQSVSTVAEESPSPTEEEFRRVVVETRLGRDLVESLSAVAERMESTDFRWVTQAVDIQRSVGGDLAEVLDTVAATIRERNQIRRHVKSLTAEGRISAYVLISLPFVIIAGLASLAPGFLDPLFQTVAGRVMLLFGALLMVLGVIWIRRIIKLEF